MNDQFNCKYDNLKFFRLTFYQMENHRHTIKVQTFIVRRLVNVFVTKHAADMIRYTYALLLFTVFLEWVRVSIVKMKAKPV